MLRMAVLMRLRADLRTRWRALLGLALLLGLVGGVALTAAAGARRTDTAYSRLLSWANASQVTVMVTNSESVLTPPAKQPPDKYFVAGGRAAEQVRRGYFGALGALPEVASVTLATEYNMALPVPGGTPDTRVQVFASRDDSLGVTGDRVKVTAGRMFGPGARGEAVIDAALASREHLRPGDVLHLIGVPKDADGSADLKLAKPLSFRVAAIGIFDDQVVTTTATTAQPRVLLSPSFAATDDAVAMTNLPEAAVRLRPGASMAVFLRDADALRQRYGIRPDNYVTLGLDSQVTATERAIRPQALALAVFAALVALVGLAVTGQLLARQLALDAADFPVLRAIGQTRAGLAAEALLRLALVTVAGGAVAVAVAVAASPLMPIGPARSAEPHPGLSVDLPVLAAGFAAIAALPLAALALAAWRVAAPRRARAASVAGEQAAAARRPSALGTALAGAGPAARAIGVRMAFDPGHGRTAVPVRTALAGTAVAVGAAVAALVFGASLIGLVATPGRYGQNWQQVLDAGYADVRAQDATALLSGIPGLAGWAAGENGAVSVDGGANVPAIAVDPVGGGTGYLTALSGRLPAGPGEIALGTQTLRALHRSVGQTVPVRVTVRGGGVGPAVTRTMRITGTVVFPAFGLPALAATDLGSGAVVTAPLLSGVTVSTHCDGSVTCYNFFLLRYRDGAVPATAAATLQARAAQAGCPPGMCTVTTDQRPGEIKNYAGIRDTPLILALVLALLAVGTLAHVLVTAVRRRRRDLAVLKSLGLTRSQLHAVVAWQATALAAGALLIGVPAGIIAGRWTWAVFATTAGVSSQATVVLPVVLLAVPAVTLILANLIAAFPGRAAARLRPATVLRTE
jgi:ABC-type antimicrobial peptide transport system permease subunit